MATLRRKPVVEQPVEKKTGLVARNGVILNKCYCRKCCAQKSPELFFTAVDLYLDTSGKMSVCKDCCNDIYEKMFAVERNVPRALYRTCKALNIKYDADAVQLTEDKIRSLMENGDKPTNIFSIYKSKVSGSMDKRIKGETITWDLTFSEPDANVVIPDPIPDNVPDAFELKQFWGDNYGYDDYVFLEKELYEWKKTHKSDTKAEELLLVEICHKSLEIRKAREIGKPTAGMVKELQDLMKTANVDPAKTSLANSGKSMDTFSSYIKTIEENEPVDTFKDDKLFKDYDNINWYFKKFLLRPLSNFLGISRLFNLEDDSIDDEIEETDNEFINKLLNNDEEVIPQGQEE